MKKYVRVLCYELNQGIEPPSLASIRLSFENTDSLCSYSEHWLVFSKNLHNSRLKSIPGSILRYICACMLGRFSHAQLIAILWTVACQASLSMRFSRQEYLSGLLFPSPGNLPDSGMEPASPALQMDASLLSHLGSPVRVNIALFHGKCWNLVQYVSLSTSTDFFFIIVHMYYIYKHWKSYSRML